MGDVAGDPSGPRERAQYAGWWGVPGTTGRGQTQTVATVVSVDVDRATIAAMIAFRDAGGVVLNHTELSLEEIHDRAQYFEQLMGEMEEEA